MAATAVLSDTDSLSNSSDFEQEESAKGKKRQRNVDKWPRNMKKRALNSGVNKVRGKDCSCPASSKVCKYKSLSESEKDDGNEMKKEVVMKRWICRKVEC